MAYFYIAAAHKSSGKTTISVGLAAAFAQKGLKVQTFKKGPDYIDPLWLEKASRQSCYNLDFNTMTKEEITALFRDKKQSSDICLIEGNKGLYDGMDIEGADSNAAMARLLNAPVILVIDCTGITRGVAPLLMGYQQFDPDTKIAGVILNKVASPRHEQKLRDVIGHYLDMPVLGAVKRDNRLFAEERHLGLIPPDESSGQSRTITDLAQMVERTIDLDALQKLALQASLPTDKASGTASAKQTRKASKLKIGLVQDSSFGFYYTDDLEAMESHGAEIVRINALTDQKLPELDGLFIGGGFPETHLARLEQNTGLRNDIYQAGMAGLPIYAECGGLMYLSRSISWQNQTSEMVGLVPGEVIMYKRPQGRGLVKLRETDGLWQGGNDQVFNCHEFHYASLENLPADSRFAFEVVRGHGITGQKDGIIIKNIQANFSHLRHSSQKTWVTEFLNFVRKVNFRG